MPTTYPDDLPGAVIVAAKLAPNSLYYVTVVCPYCGKPHAHGVAGSLTVPGLTERPAQCDGRRYYVFDDADDVFATAMGTDAHAERAAQEAAELRQLRASLGTFLGDRIRLDPNGWAPRPQIGRAFIEWARANDRPLRRAPMYRALVALPGVTVTARKGTYGLKGLALA